MTTPIKEIVLTGAYRHHAFVVRTEESEFLSESEYKSARLAKAAATRFVHKHYGSRDFQIEWNGDVGHVVGLAIPDDATCEEASQLSFTKYVRCGQKAVALVHLKKDRRSYYMCESCADHNVRNRGGILVREKPVGIVS